MDITQVKTILGRKFRGASLDDVQGVSDFTLFEEAGNNLISKVDPYETVRTQELSLFEDIFDYASPSDLKGKKVIDIRPQVNRSPADDFRQTFTEDFDRDKDIQDQFFSVQYDESTKFLRVDKSVGNSINVSDLESANYTAGTGVSNIAEDELYDAGDGKSIRFDITTGTSLLTWNGTASVDLSNHTQKSSFFLKVYLPDSTIITSLTLRIGSSAANYYEITGTVHRGSARNGWNTYRFDWNGVSDAGTTDESATDYMRLAIVSTASDTDLRIGKLSSKLPELSEVLYYSDCLFRSTTGTYKTIPTGDTDLVNLEQEAFNLYIYECCLVIASDLQRDEEAQKFRNILGLDAQGGFTGKGLYGDYKRDKPSEAVRPNNRYYGRPVGGQRDNRINR